MVLAVRCHQLTDGASADRSVRRGRPLRLPSARCRYSDYLTAATRRSETSGATIRGERNDCENPADKCCNLPIFLTSNLRGHARPSSLSLMTPPWSATWSLCLCRRTDIWFSPPLTDKRAWNYPRQYPGPIDLVITDLQMPRLNGTDLAAHLLEERPGIKVLVMSGVEMSEIVSRISASHFCPSRSMGRLSEREFERSWPFQGGRPFLRLPRSHRHELGDRSQI